MAPRRRGGWFLKSEPMALELRGTGSKPPRFPCREDLLGSALKAGLPVVDITALKTEIEKLTGIPRPAEFDYDKIAAVVEYRDGTLIDTVYGRK